jgi:hypothetical protein
MSQPLIFPFICRRFPFPNYGLDTIPTKFSTNLFRFLHPKPQAERSYIQSAVDRRLRIVN